MQIAGVFVLTKGGVGIVGVRDASAGPDPVRGAMRNPTPPGTTVAATPPGPPPQAFEPPGADRFVILKLLSWGERPRRGDRVGQPS